MGAQSTVRRTPGRAGGKARRLIPLAAALLLAALVAIPASNIALAQAPPGSEIVLVNADREFAERKGGGEFVARPVFDREIANLYYAVRDADTGDWISAMYRVKGGEKKRSDGWEYSWEYPALDEHPDLDRDRAYLMVMLAEAEDGRRGDFYAVPIHQPGRIWDKILSALSPARWAKAFAGGSSRESTGPSAELSSGRPARTPTTAGEGSGSWPTSSPARLPISPTATGWCRRRGWSSGPSPPPPWWSSWAGWA